MIYNLIRIISVICKNRYAIFIEMLQYSCCAPGTPALPVLALTDDIVSIRFRRIDKFCQCGCLRKICLISQAILRENRQVNIIQGNFK